MIQAFIALLTALPEIIKLLQTLQTKIDEAGVERKVKDDIATIHTAFANQDADALNKLFSGK